MATASNYWQCSQCHAYNVIDKKHPSCPSCGHDPSTRLSQFTPCEDEDQLHYDIIDDCKARGWKWFHGSLAHRTKRTIGEPDFFILADGGRFFMVECKDREGKPSDAQLQVAAHARKLGHVIHVVKSIDEWKALANTTF